MPLNTQDLDARFAVFLNPIRDLTKNWEVDIAKYLQEYLEELAEIQITFDGGETLMNFAEAAMLIQGSATVYSKKVEFLWQMVLGMLDLLSSKKSLENKGFPENTSDSRMSTASVNPNLNFEVVDNLPNGRNVIMKDEDDADAEQTKRESFKFLPAMPLHLVEKEGEKSFLKIKLFSKNFETFGNKEDFRINRSYISPLGCLCLELPQEILKKGALLPLNTSLAGFFLDTVSQVQLKPPINAESNLPLSPPTTDESPDDPMETEAAHDYEPPDCDISLEIEPSALPIASEFKENNSDRKNGEIVEEIITVRRHNLRKRGLPENIVEIDLKARLRPKDPHLESPSKRPIRMGRLKKPPVCACHKEYKKKSRRSCKDSPQKEKTPSIESHITKDLVDLVINKEKEGKNIEFDGHLKEKIVKVGENLNEIYKNMKKGRDIIEDELLPTEKEEVENNVPDLDFDDAGNCDDAIPEFNFPNPHSEDPEDFFKASDVFAPKGGGLSDSLLYEPSSDYEALVQKWISDYTSDAQEHIASSELAKRVNNWKKTIMPILQEEENRCHFDIHSYGSRIMSFFPKDDERSIPFETIVENENPKEVSRLFLSCLMLANTYNVELSNMREGDFEMDCLQLRLLSHVRHHKKLEEYAAPSQTIFPKRRKIKDKRKQTYTNNNEDDDEEIDDSYPLQELSVKSISEKRQTKIKRLKTKDYVR